MTRLSKRDDYNRPYLMTNGTVLMPKGLDLFFYHLAITTIGRYYVSTPLVAIIILVICNVIFFLHFSSVL